MRYYYTPFGMVKIHPPTKKKKKKTMVHIKQWWGCEATGIHIHCWWECKMVQTLWRTVWQFLIKVNILLPYDLAILLSDMYSWADFLGGPEVRTTLVAQIVKHLPTMWETWVQSLGWKDFLEKEMATHSSILAWKTPWTEETGRLQSMGLQRVGHDWATSLSFKWVENLRSH